MLVHCENGQIHLFCYLLHRFTVNAALNKGSAALWRQGVQYRLEVPQLVAGMQRGFGRMIGMKHIQFRNQFKGNDFFAPGLIYQEVARNLEQIGFAGGGSCHIAIGVSAGHAFGDQIVHVARPVYNPAQTRPQRTFMRQDRDLEPIQSYPDRFHAIPL